MVRILNVGVLSCGVGEIGLFMFLFGIGEWRDDLDELFDLIVNFWSFIIVKYLYFMNIKLIFDKYLKIIVVILGEFW